MANKATSTRRITASSAKSGQTVTIFTNGNLVVAGRNVTANTSVLLGIITPGQTSAQSLVVPQGGGGGQPGVGANITAVTKANSSYSPISGDIEPASYIVVTGTGFDTTGNLYIGANIINNTFYDSTELRANLQTAQGIITSSGNYPLNYFSTTTSKFGNLAGGITIAVNNYDIEYLVVGGGGGGSSYGGGGAGGFRTGNITTTQLSNHTVTVGAGGSGASTASNGSASTFSTVTSAGGGRGGVTTGNGAAGGSGGGGGYSPGLGGAGNTPVVVPSQGNNGGSGGNASPQFTAGGGGGAGEIGANGNSTIGGRGGNGSVSSITGVSMTYAGGGGGGHFAGSGGNSPGGTGGGGTGGKNNVGDTAGTVNTGSGGGGAGFTGSAGGNGGSGIVIIKYPDNINFTVVSGGLNYTTNTSVPGFNITTFTSGTGDIAFV